jgi:hypothetical protein
MKKIFKFLGVLSAFALGNNLVFAQVNEGGSSLLPPLINDLFKSFGIGGSGIAGFVTGRAQFLIYAVFGIIILVAVAYAVMAGIKYIRSEGDPGKIEEAQKSIKAIMMGIAAIFVAIIGIVLVYVVMGQNMVSPDLPQVCLSAGGSVGCSQYYRSGKGADNPYTKWCEGVYKYMTANKADILKPQDKGITIDDISGAMGVTPPAADTNIATENKSGTGWLNEIDLCTEPNKGGYLPKAN